MTASVIMPELQAQLQKGKRPAPPPWQRPLVGTFRHRMPVQFFDATLSHCGWVIAERVDREIRVYDHGTIHIDTDLTGYLATLEKARLLRGEIRDLLATYPRMARAVEAPAVKGNRLESSLIAGLIIWLEEVEPTGCGCAFISATHVSAVLCGNSRLPSRERKKAVKAACAHYYPESATRKWDEHQRDALAGALTHLYDMNQTQLPFKLPSFH